MTIWLLWTAALAFLLSADPHTKARRESLRTRWSFYRDITSCPPCSFGWSGCLVEIVVRSRAFVPDEWHQLLAWWSLDMLAPLCAAAAGLGLGYLIEWMSPTTATVTQIRWMEANRGKA